MTTLIILALVIVWPPVALAIAVVIGRGIRLADRRSTIPTPNDPRDI